MRPRTAAGREECLLLKQELIAEQNAGAYIVSAFSDKASANSIDEESRADGGLLGTRLRQGDCQVPELDRACFCSPLGRVTGPIETPAGYHLVLVEERLGLERYDGGMTRIVAEPLPSGGVRSVLAPPDPDEVNELVAPDTLLNLLGFALVTLVGGELLSQWASSIDLEQVANSMS